jgi:Domain of unknown function (DUF4326)
MATTVVNCKHDAYDVYIGRPSKWGNPYKIGQANPVDIKLGRLDRAGVLRHYETWIRSQPDLLAALPELKGRILGCWCKPAPCHGDVLARLADGS